VSAYARRVWIVLWKDLLIESRARESVNGLLFLALLLLFVFQFVLGPERDRVEAALPGLLWLGSVLAGLVGLGRTFLVERDNDCLDGLVLAPGDKSALFLGKLLVNAGLMAAVELVLLAGAALLYGLDLRPAAGPLAVVFALGTLGLAAMGTLYGALTVQLRARELLFPVLLLPAQVPVLLGAVALTQAALAGEPLAAAGPWLPLLAAADCVYLVVGMLTFEFILEP
jgi:heme exporter protein B